MHRLGSVLAAFLVLASAMATGGIGYRCRFDGLLRSACCCPEQVQEAHASVPGPPTASGESCCCDREQSSLDRVLSESSLPPNPATTGAPVAGLTTVDLFATTTRRRPGGDVRAGPARTAPIILLKRSFLL